MDECRCCGGRLANCNESEIVCPWCGEADCWPRLDELIVSDLDDFDLDFDLDPTDDAAKEDTS
jgi:hypothetical protein